MPDDHLSRSDLEQLFPEHVLTVEHIASRLCRCETTILRAIKREELTPLPGLGRPWVVTRSAVIEWALGPRNAQSTARPRPACDRATPEHANNDQPPFEIPRQFVRHAVDRRRAMTPKRKAA